MKKLILFVVLFSLPACVGPPALTVASLALSGVSYVETGKTLPDHALSSVAQRDCIVFRAARGEQICQASGDLPAENVPGTDVVTAPARLDRRSTADPRPQPTSPGLSAAVWAHPVPEDSHTASPDASARAVLAAAPQRPARVEPNGVARNSVAARAIQGDQVVAQEAAKRPIVTPRYRLVVGSFRERARAEVHLAQLEVTGLDIVIATVDERTQYRVVTAPLLKDAVAAAKQDFADKGVEGAWAIRDRGPSAIQLAAR